MKKVFTTLFAAFGMAAALSAATVDDIKPMQHSYVMVFDNYTGNGTVARTKGTLFGGNYFLDVTGGTISTAKGSVDIANASTYAVTYGGAEADTSRLAAKYTSYGSHYNSLRLKNAQDVIAFKPTAGSVVYVFGQGNNKTGKDARVPKFAKDAALTEALNEAPTEDYPGSSIYCYKFVVPADFDGSTPLYIGSYNGDAFFSFIVVEANEPAGTPSVEVGLTQYDETEKLYYQEVTCTPNDYVLMEGMEGVPTTVYYTTDGTEPTDQSAQYTEPIKCYKDMTVKFQAYSQFGKCEGANNEATVEFIFNAPTLTVDGANATIVSEYQNATNYYSIDGAEAVAGDSYTATASCNIAVYTEIKNGEHATWTSSTVSAPIYVLDPIKEKKVVTVTGTYELDEEATAANTNKDENGNPLPIYVADGKLQYNGQDADPCFYLVPEATFSVILTDTAQVNGQEIYLQMSKDLLTFMVAEGDSVDVKVTVSKNSHKNAETLMTYVNLNGTNYGHENILEDGNVIEFGLTGGIYTFKKYSGTGNIHVASIEITPVAADGIKGVQAGVQTALDQNAPIYDLTGRQVANPVKGIYLQNGKKFIVR
ncbi:MAG: chitobiase/beta-hexosaminidase C-terminal domain-containing protein [Bacteroidaceae bacterium]|nr:chitobiase/beta-hexosaminidase C-terminal domain-containing protein [Bacteroidaceae bacterium]